MRRLHKTQGIQLKIGVKCHCMFTEDRYFLNESIMYNTY